MNMVCLQMKACGLRISARRFRHTISIGENSSLQKTRRRLSNLSKSIRRLIPILRLEYSLARIVYTCLRKLGLQEKCPVVCFDGSDNIVQESMFTHVKQNEKEIGSLSVRLLADEIRGDDEVKTVLVPYHIREMTKTAMD